MILKTMMTKLEMSVLIGDISLACLAFCNHRENPLQKESIRARIQSNVISYSKNPSEGKSVRMGILYGKNPLEQSASITKIHKK